MAGATLPDIFEFGYPLEILSQPQQTLYVRQGGVKLLFDLTSAFKVRRNVIQDPTVNVFQELHFG